MFQTQTTLSQAHEHMHMQYAVNSYSLVAATDSGVDPDHMAHAKWVDDTVLNESPQHKPVASACRVLGHVGPYCAQLHLDVQQPTKKQSSAVTMQLVKTPEP